MSDSNFSVSGTVENETYEKTIRQETKEEIVLDLKSKKLFIYKSFNSESKKFASLFIAKSDEKLILDKREIDSIKWISLNKLKAKLEQIPEKYVPRIHKGIKIFFKN